VTISPYVARLRSLVGTELLQLPSVAVLPIDTAGRVLLVRHADTGVWGLVGGAIELDERPFDAAVRETLEEIGVDATLGRLIGVFGGLAYRVEYSSGDQVSYVVIAYEATLRSDELSLDGDEVIEVGWFDTTSLATADLNGLAAALLREIGRLDVESGAAH
jgi:ADP-ribose pyrophosphatase YjhB (NUDIX family)